MAESTTNGVKTEKTDKVTPTTTPPPVNNGKGQPTDKKDPPKTPEQQKETLPPAKKKEEEKTADESKWDAFYSSLPNEALASTARTFGTRLHFLRLQKEHHKSTHERLTKGDAKVPSSCVLKFELGASQGLQEKPEYLALKSKVEDTLKTSQTSLMESIVELQTLEMQVKEDEIAKTFCEGVYKTALTLINYHRDNSNGEIPISKNMQSQRLADRLAELMMEQHPELLEFGYFSEVQKYYSHVGRNRPTHSRLQNRNAKTSPYNDHHTQFLQAMLDEYTTIIQVCFHNSWKDHVEAASLSCTINKQKLMVMGGAPPPVVPVITNTATATTTAAAATNIASASSTQQPPHPEQPVLPTMDALKEMVQSAVTQETQALRDIIQNLEDQLSKSRLGETSATTGGAENDDAWTPVIHRRHSQRTMSGGGSRANGRKAPLERRHSQNALHNKHGNNSNKKHTRRNSHHANNGSVVFHAGANHGNNKKEHTTAARRHSHCVSNTGNKHWQNRNNNINHNHDMSMSDNSNGQHSTRAQRRASRKREEKALAAMNDESVRIEEVVGVESSNNREAKEDADVPTKLNGTGDGAAKDDKKPPPSKSGYAYAAGAWGESSTALNYHHVEA